ncbi:hypothetical protein NL676_001084 [Syzygium grande]|nr:hypothetical protein NL676_001084 [Syzygium grande]
MVIASNKTPRCRRKYDDYPFSRDVAPQMDQGILPKRWSLHRFKTTAHPDPANTEVGFVELPNSFLRFLRGPIQNREAEQRRAETGDMKAKLLELKSKSLFGTPRIYKKFKEAQDYDHPTATLSTRRTNNATAYYSIQYTERSIVWSILLQATTGYGPAYARGFYCNGTCNNYLFAMFIVVPDRGVIGGENGGLPQVVWSANRNNPIKSGAMLELTSKGKLVLKDADGTVAWSTNTSGKSVIGLNLTDSGNLVLFDAKMRRFGSLSITLRTP